jgi:Protein of unknown function (DUF3822)
MRQRSSVTKIYYFAALKIMAKILFDIPAEEQVDWQYCHLVMEISQHIFSYVVMNEEKEAICIRVYETDVPDYRELAAELEEIIFEDEILKKKGVPAIVMYNFPECQLVPANYFQSNTAGELIELLYGDLNHGIILNEKINDFDKYNVFRVPLEVHHLFQRVFVNGKYWHYYSVWLQCMQQAPEAAAEYISVLFYPNRILVACLKNNQPQLLQSFLYEVVEDVAYYLLNICDQLNFSPATTLVKLSGMIDESSALYSEIYKYFGQTSLDVFPVVSPAAGFDEYPPHFFSPLLKLAACVS